ncbi:FAD-dependent monooxygenase [Spirosoma sp. BT702]|uniref:FAD-dependent monooxygenase n=1 Tax=Spirosoma profusum TaxID=2771354 RepID=A0A926Y3E1_9BACT|nr:NAD(P)/FAD-dependent oxidoreductase [Spirosoma profusum]MBD2703982.1 FAD-dependent monooxygenase [Spirosoma profusum]
MADQIDVLIIGGGLAGLVSALELIKAGHSVTLVERKTYPFHKVCGEYVSNEVRRYVESLGVDLARIGVADIHRLQVSAPSGRSLESELDLGGFGISRYRFDNELYQLGKAAGVRFLLNKQVDTVTFQEAQNGSFTALLNDGQLLTSRLVIGAYGKRSKLDRTLNRAFTQRPSPYLGVKYHIQLPFPDDTIALHNFPHGYCGLSAIEDNRYCLCYLTTREHLRRFGAIPQMEQAVLYQNPHLRNVFENARFLYDKPEVINEISFAPKRAVENHMLMAGDSAGLITPLCGNGMAMAIHSARLVSSLSTTFLQGQISRTQLEDQYQRRWSAQFTRRLWFGRHIQQLFGHPLLTEVTVRTFATFKPALRMLIRQTHG